MCQIFKEINYKFSNRVSNFQSNIEEDRNRRELRFPVASTFLYRRILQVYLFFEQGKDGAFTDSCPVKKKQLLVMNYQKSGTTKFPSLLSESIAFKMITIVIINASLTVA